MRASRPLNPTVPPRASRRDDASHGDAEARRGGGIRLLRASVPIWSHNLAFGWGTKTSRSAGGGSRAGEEAEGTLDTDESQNYARKSNASRPTVWLVNPMPGAIRLGTPSLNPECDKM
jgi:hypothetical protein